MTPLATEFGGWSAEKWAAQLVLAINHFVDANQKAEKWGAMDPVSIMKFADEMEKTYQL